MDLKVLAEVNKWIEKEEKQLEYFIFTNKKGNPYLDSSSLNRTLKLYCKQLDIEKNISCHSFRHMFITGVIEKHGLETARVLANRKKSKITEEYIHSRFEFHRKKFYKGEKKKRKAIAEGEIDQEQVNNEMIGILMEA